MSNTIAPDEVDESGRDAAARAEPLQPRRRRLFLLLILPLAGLVALILKFCAGREPPPIPPAPTAVDCGGCDLAISFIEVHPDAVFTLNGRKYQPTLFGWKNKGKVDLVIGPSGCPSSCASTPTCSIDPFTCPFSSVKDILRFAVLDANYYELKSWQIPHSIGHEPFTKCNEPYHAQGEFAALKAGCEEEFLSSFPIEKAIDITDLSPGQYRFKVCIDAANRIIEADELNNCASFPFRVACPSGTKLCDGNCVDVSSDVEHCGDCETSCRPGEPCKTGVCICTPHCNFECGGGNGCGGTCDCPHNMKCVEHACVPRGSCAAIGPPCEGDLCPCPCADSMQCMGKGQCTKCCSGGIPSIPGCGFPPPK